MKLAIDTTDVPEEFRNAKFEEELLQFHCQLTVDTTSPRWLFRLALHEGAHWFYMPEGERECTLRGPHVEYRDGEFHRFFGAVQPLSPTDAMKFWERADWNSVVDIMKKWLSGPLAVTTLTGEEDDPEPDILGACRYLGLSRGDGDLYLYDARKELLADFRNPVIVGEILEAARKYANAIFHDDSCVNGIKKNGKPCGTQSDCHGDFCVDWGIKRYRLPSSSCQAAQEACGESPLVS
jgi:hypothetical protein